MILYLSEFIVIGYRQWSGGSIAPIGFVDIILIGFLNIERNQVDMFA